MSPCPRWRGTVVRRGRSVHAIKAAALKLSLASQKAGGRSRSLADGTPRSLVGLLQAVRDEEAVAELQEQLQAAQEAAAAANKAAVAAKGQLFTLRASGHKAAKGLSKEIAALKQQVAEQKSLNETVRTSSQHVRLQLEVSKVRHLSTYER